MAEQLGIYTFCAILSEKKQTFNSIEIDGKKRKVYTIHFQDTAMVVAQVPLKIYPPKKHYLLAHEKVVAFVMDHYTVIPMSFGNVFPSEADVLALLKKLHPQFTSIFPQIDNKIEVGLKVMAKKEWLENEIKKNDQILRLSEVISQKGEDAAFYDKIKLGDMAQQFFLKMSRCFTEEIYEPLAHFAGAGKLNETVGERMLINAAFLIDRTKEFQFDEMVNELYDKWQDKVEFKYTGPWPPYNFINIRLTGGREP